MMWPRRSARGQRRWRDERRGSGLQSQHGSVQLETHRLRLSRRRIQPCQVLALAASHGRTCEETQRHDVSKARSASGRAAKGPARKRGRPHLLSHQALVDIHVCRGSLMRLYWLARTLVKRRAAKRL